MRMCQKNGTRTYAFQFEAEHKDDAKIWRIRMLSPRSTIIHFGFETEDTKWNNYQHIVYLYDFYEDDIKLTKEQASSILKTLFKQAQELDSQLELF